jgi:hypothetical protein
VAFRLRAKLLNLLLISEIHASFLRAFKMAMS